MKAKDLLIALKTDGDSGLENLSTYQVVFLKNETTKLTKIDHDEVVDQIHLIDDHTSPLSLNDLVQVLSRYKEAALYIDQRPVYGYRLIPQGLVIG